MNTERPYNVALSRDEVVALVKYHTAEMRKVTNRVGKMALEFHIGRDLKRLHDVASEEVYLHSKRGKELLAIVKPAEGKS